MATRIQIRRDTAANWTTEDPVLASGEFALETDTNKIKCGDGSTAWASLNYITEVTTGNFPLPDNSQVTFGDADDLKIYHDGTHSYVLDTGTGNLYIRGAAQVVIGSTTGEKGVVFNENGAVQLYHDDSLKVATTSTGAAITGGVTVSGGASITGNVTGANATITNLVTAANLTASSTVTADTVDLGDWTVTQTGSNLLFAYNGVDKMKLDPSGNLTLTGILTENGTI